MQAMYDASQQEVAELRAELEASQGEVARERERAAEVSAENSSLRQWNEQLNADMRRLLNELRSEASVNDADAKDEPGHEAEEAEVSHLLGAAAGSASSANITTGISVDISVLQQAQLEASATALRLTHTQARLKRKGKELRASASQVAQLKETAQALATDLSAATAQIGKLETRISQQAEISRKLEQLTAEHSAQAETLEQTNEALGRAKEEQAALANGPLAEAERRIHELEARERRSRVLLERKADAQPYKQPYAQPRLASSGSTSPGAHRSSSPRAPPPSAGSVEALQSQSALQEKLRKVRSTFADIRRQVGYDFE